MKILFVHSLSTLVSKGGAEVSLRVLTQALTDAGHECVLLVTGGESGIRHSEKRGIKIIEVGIRNIYSPFDGHQRAAPMRFAWHGIDSFNPLMKTIVAKVCAAERPEVASVHNMAGWSIAVWDALQEQGVPIVQVLHDQYLLCAASTMFRDGQNCMERCLSCRILRLPHRARSCRLAAVVGVSQFILDHHRQFGYFKGVPLQQVIHNARSYKVDEHSMLPSSQGANRATRYGFIGSITPVKGVDYLIRAFSGVRLAKAELLVAGDLNTEYARGLESQTSDSRVRFLGRVSPEDFFQLIDVLVLPSLWRDTFPGVAFESLIFGRPVIAVNHGGVPEIIHHERNGLIFNPHELGALSGCLERLAAAPDLLRRMSNNAAQDGAHFLNVDRWVKQYLAVYREAASQATSNQQHRFMR